MPFLATPNGIQVELRFTQDGQRVENAHWFMGPTMNPTPAELETVADMVQLWWEEEVQPIQSNTVNLREIYVTDQSVVDGETFTYSPTVSTTGANVNAPLPNNVTVAISFRTSRRGRSFRGRAYVIGLTANQVAASHLTPAAATAWVAAYDSLVNRAALAGFQLCVCSKIENGNPRMGGLLTPVNDALITDDTVDSQRRRLPGRGE